MTVHRFAPQQLLGRYADRCQGDKVEDRAYQAAVLHDERGEQSPYLALLDASPVALQVLE